MGRVDSAYLDCVSDVVALLLAHAGVADVRTPFAYQRAFRVVGGIDGVLEPDLPPRARDRSVARFTGLRPKWTDIESTAECLDSWAAELGRGNAVAVTADAFFLPWLPYCGNEHMEHGFVVEGVEGGREPVLHVVDPYENRTRRGHARPTTTKVVLGDLGHALDRGAWAVLEPCGRRNRWTPNAKSGRTAKPGHARRHQLISAFSAQEARGSLFFAVHRGVIP
jgi:hypothetical protein